MFSKFITFLYLILFVSTPLHAAEEAQRNDPAFFKFVTNDSREIYILGSLHTVPLRKMFDPATLIAIDSIANKRAILYTEHISTNEFNLAQFENPANLIPEDAYEGGNTLFTSADVFLSPEAEAMFQRKKVKLNAFEEGKVDLQEVLKARLWLGAVTLGTHAGIMYSSQFGGTEHDLMAGELKELWGDVLYLETPEEALGLLQKHKDGVADMEENKNWVKKSLEKIMLIENGDKESIDRITLQQKISIKNYSWDFIKLAGLRKRIPESAIARNQLWVNKIMSEHFSAPSESKTPIMIVIGNGHIAGFNEGFSFVRLLMESLKVKTLERFSNRNGWITINQPQ